MALQITSEKYTNDNPNTVNSPFLLFDGNIYIMCTSDNVAFCVWNQQGSHYSQYWPLYIPVWGFNCLHCFTKSASDWSIIAVTPLQCYICINPVVRTTGSTVYFYRLSVNTLTYFITFYNKQHNLFCFIHPNSCKQDIIWYWGHCSCSSPKVVYFSLTESLLLRPCELSTA